MKIKHWTVLAVVLVIGLDGPSLRSQQPAPAASPESPPPVTEPVTPGNPTGAAVKTGVIKAQRVNVRGKAQRKSEVVTQLNRGDQITVLEEITVKKPLPGEPTAWVRILLPRDVPVWVHGSFVDGATRTIKADRLNMRSGPGENFSVLGQIERGTQVEILETKGDWIKIPAPPEAGAFVAAFLVDMQATSPAVAVAAPVITETIPVAPDPAPSVETGSEPITTPPPSIPVEIVEVDVADPLSSPSPVEIETVEPAEDPSPVEVVMIDPVTDIVEETPEPELVKRTVHREGIVNRTLSIQAPTYYMLHSVQNGKIINYLFSPNGNIVLKDFYGARVIVSGEELIDERWPNIPVINVDSLETVP